MRMNISGKDVVARQPRFSIFELSKAIRISGLYPYEAMLLGQSYTTLIFASGKVLHTNSAMSRMVIAVLGFETLYASPDFPKRSTYKRASTASFI